ncbi:mechanosensitive ion channel domain-containing protein [Ottowia sp.]|uniref:mechanosensitive ion channel domain-containing protein n=1 Tax=Ottowia sp. TaxID=1898956 RepID=UPI00395C5870
MIELIRHYRSRLPDWVKDWLDVIVPGAQIALIVLLAWALNGLFKHALHRLERHYGLPLKLMVPLRGIVRWIIILAAGLLVLGRLGVSGEVLWTAFTGFAAVGAVAFFAAWSVLSNLFCALLIMTVQPFRLGDDIEVLDTAEKPGARGRVKDINLLYTTLEEGEGEQRRLLQIPNALIFQRVVRRWPGVGAAAKSNLPATGIPMDRPVP